MDRSRIWRAALWSLVVAWIAAAPAAAVEIDEPAPALKGVLVSGQSFDLADYRGKVVLVNFFSSYCRGCAVEIGTLETFQEQYQARGFEILVIGVDRLDDKARVEHMLSTYNLQGGMADELVESGFERRYPTPTAFVVDRDGIVRARMSGAKTPPRLRELMEPFTR